MYTDAFLETLHGREFEIRVFECEPGRFRAETFLGVGECVPPHGASVTDRFAEQHEMERRFEGTGNSAEAAVQAVREQVEAAVIPLKG